MTTIPSRIDHIRPVIESALSQTVRVQHVEINIPYWCVKTGTRYVIPEWLKKIDGVLIFRCEDYGPITKIGPTFLRYFGDKETYLWSVDDDCAYPPNQLELLCLGHNPSKRQILTRHGGDIDQATGKVQYLYGEAEVMIFEAFGSILYPPACVGADFAEFMSITSANSVCRKHDDAVLSFYFRRRGLPIYLYNKPSEEAPWANSGWLPHAHTDALVDSVDFAKANKEILAFIESL